MVGNRGGQIPSAKSPRSIIFFTAAPDIGRSSVLNLFPVTILVPIIFEMAPRFLEYLCTPDLKCSHILKILYILTSCKIRSLPRQVIVISCPIMLAYLTYV
jgi:hypothetical protein